MLNDHNFKCNFSTLTVFTFLFRNNPPPPEILTMSRAQRDSDVPVFSDRLPCTPLSGAATALPEWSCLSPQDLRSSPAGDPSSPQRGACSPAESTSAGLRGPAAHRGQGRRLSISDAFVSGGAEVAFPTANGKTGMILHKFLVKTVSGKPIIMQTAILIK